MIFMVGIESIGGGQYSMIVPAFSEIGDECISSSDNEKEIIANVTDTILVKVQAALFAGVDLSDFDRGYEDFSQHSDYESFDRWLAVDIDLSGIDGKPERVNISLKDTLLLRIDTFVAKRPEFTGRSHLIALAATDMMNTYGKPTTVEASDERSARISYTSSVLFSDAEDYNIVSMRFKHYGGSNTRITLGSKVAGGDPLSFLASGEIVEFIRKMMSQKGSVLVDTGDEKVNLSTSAYVTSITYDEFVAKYRIPEE
jgi:metal-responsive CopG/Arc/MetJ family transcriptional regulator